MGILQALYSVHYLPRPLISLLMKNKSAQIQKVQSNMSLDFKPLKAGNSTSKCPKYFDYEKNLIRRTSDTQLKDSPSLQINYNMVHYKIKEKLLEIYKCIDTYT